MVMFKKIQVTSFGKLNNFTLELREGINIMQAPNEFGKSTLASFVKFVLYGFVSTKMREISENDKKMYIPWDGSVASGSITLEKDENVYIIERSYALPSNESVKIIDLMTGKEAYPGLCPGEVFFGVDEDAFSKTAFIGQMRAPINRGGSLAANIQNLMYSSDEQTCAEKALKRLNSAKDKLKNRGLKGIIPELENELRLAEKRVTDSETAKSDLERLVELLAENESDTINNTKTLEKLRQERANVEKYNAHLQYVAILDLANAEKESKLQYEAATAVFKNNNIPQENQVQKLVELNSAALAIDKNIAAMDAEIDAQKTRFEENAKKREEKYPNFSKEECDIEHLSLILATIRNINIKKYVSLSITVMLFALTIALCFSDSLVYVAISFVLFITFTFVFSQSYNEYRLALKKYRVVSPKELSKMIDEIPELINEQNEELKKIDGLRKKRDELVVTRKAVQEEMELRIGDSLGYYEEEVEKNEAIQRVISLATNAEKCKSVYENRKQARIEALGKYNIEELAEQSRDALEPDRDLKTVNSDIWVCETRAEKLTEKRIEFEKKKASIIASTTSIALLVSKRDEINERLKMHYEKYHALNVAIEALENASTYMRETITPKISKYASEYFDGATDGKYDSLQLDPEFAMTFTDSAYIKSSDYLSAGTKETAYVCLRLALLKLLFKNGTTPPVILDDAFGRLDNARLVYMLRMLAKASEETKFQVILFTCVDREAKVLDAMKIENNKLLAKK